ncbi:MAG TPA: M28 family metallopeptidase [Nitrososphaeraceae archaeon]|nr:M28 family metallopeptidase [Nitrososphaeraceae archaeon]
MANFSNFNFVNSSKLKQTIANNNSNYSSSCVISIMVCLNDIYPNILTQSKKEMENLQIDHILGQVNSTKLKEYVDLLSSFPTRHTKSHYMDNVANWLKNKFENVCEGSVFFHNYTQSDQNKTYHLKNVVCMTSDINNSTNNNNNNNNNNTIKQNLSSYSHHNNTIIIGAHYDNRAKNFNNTYARAPGADDNASGVSAVLELSRILSHLDLKYNLQFVFFSGEEQGFWGSKNYVKYLDNNNRTKNIDLYINFDMVGHPPSNESNKVDLEYDVGNKFETNDKYSKTIALFIKQIASKYTNLNATLSKFGGSDFIPFEASNMTAIGIHDEGSDKNLNYHNSTDLPNTLNIRYLTLVTKMTLASILELCNVLIQCR